MSRAAFFNALISNPILNAIGLTQDTIFHNYSSEERPSDSTPFVIFRWGDTLAPRWQTVKSPEQLTIWIHWPAELTSDYSKLINIFDEIDSVAKNLRDVPGSDGYTLSFVTIGGRSGDLFDEGFNTITKNASYELHSRRS